MLPNLVTLSLSLNAEWADEHYDCFNGLADILPGTNPKHLLVDFNKRATRDQFGYPTFGNYTQSWTRLETIAFVCDFEFEEDEGGSPSAFVDALLYESVALLEGLSILENQRPKVVFDRRVFADPSEGTEMLGAR